MSYLAVGAGVTLSASALLYTWFKRQATGSPSDSPSDPEGPTGPGAIARPSTRAELQSLIAEGGKLVVYLSASW